MPDFGQRPQDVVVDNRGNALRKITVQFFATEADALANTNSVGSAVTDDAGRWSFSYELEDLYARLPNATVWNLQSRTGVTGVTDHGMLTGLADDDHPQYHNDARGDARYYTKTEVDQQIGAIPTGATWDTLAGKPATFPPDAHTHPATAVTFTPAGGVTATDVQAAIEQAATMGGSGGTVSSDVKNVYYVSGAYESLPSTPDAAWRLVVYHGPVAPVPPNTSAWVNILFDWQVRG